MRCLVEEVYKCFEPVLLGLAEANDGEILQ
jgi:hypothetical protein